MFTIEDFLRKEVKMLHALQDIKYKEIAEYLEIKPDSLLKWLKGRFSLSKKNQARLYDIINTLKE